MFSYFLYLACKLALYGTWTKMLIYLLICNKYVVMGLQHKLEKHRRNNVKYLF